jgi:hypothetical protein
MWEAPPLVKLRLQGIDSLKPHTNIRPQEFSPPSRNLNPVVLIFQYIHSYHGINDGPEIHPGRSKSDSESHWSWLPQNGNRVSGFSPPDPSERSSLSQRYCLRCS